MKKLIFTSVFLLSFLSAVAFTEISPVIPVVCEGYSVTDAGYHDADIEYNDMHFSFREDRENELVLVKCTGENDTIIVPETVEGCTVTAINNFVFCNYRKARYVTLPDTIDYFGLRVFEDSALVSVNIPRSLKIIPSETFRNCKNLETVLWHDDIVAVGKDAFNGTDIEIPPVIIDSAGYINDSYGNVYQNGNLFYYGDFGMHIFTDTSTGIPYCCIDRYKGSSTDIVIP